MHWYPARSASRRRFAGAAVLFSAAAACGNHGSDNPPAVHPPFPVVLAGGGSVLASPSVRLLTFPGTQVDLIDDALTRIPGSYWAATTREYGVGALLIRPSIPVPSAPDRIDDAGLQSLLRSTLAGSRPDPETIYLAVLPPSSTLLYEDEPFCGGFHSSFAIGDTQVHYGVAADCSQQPGGDPTSEELLVTMSHELIEAATNPEPADGRPAHETIDPDHFAWQWFIDESAETDISQGEIADICKPEMFPVPGTPYYFAKAWSNVSSLAGHDPCVPATGEPYHAAIPVLDDDVTLSFDGDIRVTTKGIRIPAGETRNVEVHLHSDVDADAPWTVLVGGANPPVDNWGVPVGFQAAFAGTRAYPVIADSREGTVVLAITRLKGFDAGTSLFVLSSSPAAVPVDASAEVILPTTTNWPFVVGE
jgi:hypothetical protein